MYKTSYFFNTKIVDKGFLELIGPFGIYKFFFKLSYFLRNFTPHVIFFSVGYMFIGLFLFLSFIILKESLFIILENNVLLIFAMVIFFIEIEKKKYKKCTNDDFTYFCLVLVYSWRFKQ